MGSVIDKYGLCKCWYHYSELQCCSVFTSSTYNDLCCDHRHFPKASRANTLFNVRTESNPKCHIRYYFSHSSNYTRCALYLMLHYRSHKSQCTLHLTQVTLHITDPTSHITRWGPHRKSTESKGWPCSPRESCYEIKPRPTPADFNNSAYSQSPTFIFSSVRVEGWWGMLEAKHSANSWLFPGPRYHWPGFLLGQNRAWTIEFWAAGCSLFAYLACHADEATSLDMSLHHPAALECTLHHN